MADSQPSEKPKAGAESPTTARELDFDDEPQETGVVSSPTRAAKSASPKRVSFQDEEAPPAKPPRPLSPQVQAENTLIEAFPSIDAKVVKAVLVASGGNVEPAFNALLSMSDPDFQQQEAAPPPQPPRPTQAQRQLDADERYARQLAEHYESTERAQQGGYGPRGGGNPPLPRRSNQRRDEQYEDRDRSFFDDIADDLPVIRENITKGFLETQSKVNKWISDFRKRIDGDDDDPYNGPPRMEGPSQGQRQNYGSDEVYGIRRSSDMRRKSADRERYDSDPRVLGDDFTALELRDDEATSAPQQSRRPLANPDLFKPSPAPPQSGPVDEVDAIDRKLQRRSSPNNNAKSAKWQSLTSVAPNPETEDDNDPFSLGDSDDEKDSKTKDLREGDSARLKEAARKSISEGSSEAPAKTLQASEQSGSKNKEAEAILTGKS